MNSGKFFSRSTFLPTVVISNRSNFNQQKLYHLCGIRIYHIHYSEWVHGFFNSKQISFFIKVLAIASISTTMLYLLQGPSAQHSEHRLSKYRKYRIARSLLIWRVGPKPTVNKYWWNLNLAVASQVRLSKTMSVVISHLGTWTKPWVHRNKTCSELAPS